jgi:ATP-dependent helicase/nuclease subunit A
MAERSWTAGQKAAINTRDRTLLVSAAAGSGKTATLTERIIRSILDENDPINIEEMLIVTYTRAAVGELRERIGKAVKSAIKERPEDERLERQLHMLPSARISTID